MASNQCENGASTATEPLIAGAPESCSNQKQEESSSQRRDKRVPHNSPSKRKPKRAKMTKADLKFDLAPPQYSFAKGFRFVAPYVYEYRNFAKQRWINEPLCNLFQSEFGAYPPEYYDFAIRSGRITVNGELSDPTHVVRNGDFIVHRVSQSLCCLLFAFASSLSTQQVLGNRPTAMNLLSQTKRSNLSTKTTTWCVPMTVQPITMLALGSFLTDYLPTLKLVVCKPSSMPTHPCGAYRHNSLHSIVAFMRPDLTNLHIVHRLDRLTSGVVIFAKTPAKARQLATCIADREASKTYLARVRGDLSSLADNEFQQKLQGTAQKGCSTATVRFDQSDNGSMLIDCPLRCISHKEGVWECHEEGKESSTRVRFLKRIDDETSLVECKPITGRTHQIRLHLQLIGFPIANDPCYGGELHYGGARLDVDEAAQTNVPSPPRDEARDQVLLLPQQPGEDEETFMKRTCEWCRQGEASAFKELQLHCTHIWLHALEYKVSIVFKRVRQESW